MTVSVSVAVWWLDSEKWQFEFFSIFHTLAWNDELVKQLPLRYRNKFPAVLTYHAAIDKSLMQQLRVRTEGNSVGLLHTQIKDQWSLNDCASFGSRITSDCLRYFRQAMSWARRKLAECVKKSSRTKRLVGWISPLQETYSWGHWWIDSCDEGCRL